MKPLPLPMRIAAGLAVTAVDQARRVPERLAELPVTMVSQALQLSMRVQQQVTELAIKGDDLLSGLRQAEQAPEWARFDEDEGADTGSAPAPSNGARSRFDTVTLTAVADLDDTDGDETDGDEINSDEPHSAVDVADTAAEETDQDGPLPSSIVNYPELTVPQLRARLRRLDIAELEQLLRYERTHANRPEFTGMLSRRIATMRAAQ
jgi:hypothetical protein